MIEYLGFFAALIIGLILGLIGGGGSILAMPVLVYLLGLNPVIAAAYSLFIVGTTSAFGSIQNYRNGLIDVKTGIKFAIPSLIAIYTTRKFIIPRLPENLFSVGQIVISREVFIMVIFSVVMLFAAVSMIQEKKQISTQPVSILISIVQIFIVGIIIGLIGAGGGFLIVPTLIYTAKLPMRKAVGTSVFIIAINSLIGFLGDIGHFEPNWYFLLVFSFLSILGIFAGIYLNRFINEKILKKSFGWFVLSTAVLILIKEIVL